MPSCPSCYHPNSESLRYCVACGHEFDQGLVQFLEANGLGQHLEIFRRNDLLSIKDVLSLGDSDLRELELPYGDLVRLRAALQAAVPSPPAPIQSEDTVGAMPPAGPASVPVAERDGGSRWVVGLLCGLGALALWFVFSGQRENSSATSEGGAMPAPQGAVSGDVIRVPQDHATIASAMAVAPSGSTVLLAPGVYEECVRLKSGVSLRGADKDSVTIRNVGKPAPVILAVGVSSASVSDLSIDQQLFETGDSRFDAVELRNSSVDLRNCRVTCRSSAGIWITGSGSNTVAGCLVEKCGRSGIYVLDSDGRSELQRNNCRGNNGSGILVENGIVSIRENSCSENTWDGISVSRSEDAEVVDNFSSGNLCHGIAFVGGSAGRVAANTCSDNGYSGIAVRGSSTRVQIANNEARGNRQYGIAVETSCSPLLFEGNAAFGNKRGDIQRQAVFQ